MNFEEFKNIYALTMMFYQRIEHDIKLIYAFMLKGDADDNFDSIENETLGAMIRTLERLDHSDNRPFISKSDYQFLKRICDRRNYWAHQAFVDFIYTNDPLLSKEYLGICHSLKKDYREVEKASDILEEMRVESCEKYRN